MTDVRLLGAEGARPAERHPLAALDLARRLPSLVVAARQVAATVLHGVHGRRRAGMGETFWQFRPFTVGESTTQIDWRRSARDDRVYVREREWEAAHTIWIWVDRSPSMAYVSALAREPKIDRALTLGLAAADLLVRGGERVGLPGLTRPLATRAIVDRFAEAFIEEAARPDRAPQELPAPEPLAPRSQAVLIGDFLSDAADIARTIETMASRGALGHVLMIADPVEETFPFTGHTELVDVDGPARMRVGDAAALQATYVARLAAHRDAIRATCIRLGWTFAIHRTDRPASEALLALRMSLEAASDAASSPALTTGGR